MKLDKLPIYYRYMNKEAIEEKKQSAEHSFYSEYHNTQNKEPHIFYKAISKIIPFGINNKQNI